MAAYKIGDYEFEIWRREPPQLAGELIVSHTRAGSDGVGQQQLGKWGRPFEAELVAWIGGGTQSANFLAAKLLVPKYQDLRTLGPQKITYENIDYLETFQTKYSVDDVVELSCQAKTLLAGATTSYANGVALTVLFRMTPHLESVLPIEEES